MTERNPDAGQGDEPESKLPPDEEAAWAAIVAGYGEWPDVDEPQDGRQPDGDTLTRPDDGPRGEDAGKRGEAADGARDGEADGDGGDAGQGTGSGETPARSVTVYAAGSGPRDWRLSESGDSGSGEEDDDEGHFVPPDPPPLPAADPTTKFAWLAVLGGPLLLIAGVIFRFEMTWWVITLGVGGFLGGFATLVARMRDDRDDDFEDPGRGAVV